MVAVPNTPSAPRSIPRVRGLPIVGNLLEFRQDRSKLAIRVAREFGDVARLRVGFIPVLMVACPELVREVLVDKDDCFVKTPGLSYFARPLLGKGLLTSEHDFHKKQRRMIQPMFVHKHIAGYAATFVERAEKHAARWVDGRPLDVGAAMMALTLEIVGKTLFDAEIGDEAQEIGAALTTAMESVIDSLNQLVPMPNGVPTPKNLRNRRAVARLDATIYRMIEQRRRAGVKDRGDLLSLLLAARDQEGDQRGMDDKQVRDEAMTLFLAGHETTANALAWSWWLLSQNPEHYARLQREADEVLGGRSATIDDVPKLPFALQVMKEAMRLYPPAYVVGRMSDRAVTIAGEPLGRHSIVMVNIIGMHRRPEIWADPDTFDPDRFSAEREKSIPRHAYLPFGAGPRVCIGNHFAMMEGQLVLATLAQRVRFEPTSRAPIAPEPLVTLRPKGGVPMIVRRRG